MVLTDNIMWPGRFNPSVQCLGDISLKVYYIFYNNAFFMFCRQNRAYSKYANHWQAYPVKEAKEYDYVPHMMLKMIQTLEEGGELVSLRRPLGIPEGDPRRIAPTIAKIPPPSTKEIVRKQRSRFTTTTGPSKSH
jgi:hypothetical protein